MNHSQEFIGFGNISKTVHHEPSETMLLKLRVENIVVGKTQKERDGLLVTTTCPAAHPKGLDISQNKYKLQ